MPNPGNKRADRGRSFRCASAGRATPHAARTKPASGSHKPVSKPPTAPTRPPEPTCQLSYGLCNPGTRSQAATWLQKPPRSIPGRVFFQDVVLDNLHLDPRFVVDTYLSKYIRQFPNVMPVFKYLQDLGDDAKRGAADYAAGLESLDSFRTHSIRKSMESTRRRFAGHTSVAGLVEECAPDIPFHFIPMLHDDEIDVDELGHALKAALLATEKDSSSRMRFLKDTDFRKCVRIYDFLRYSGKT